MKIIFSRKGFDSSSGGNPSPIFPDGRILSLPIPDRQSPIRYQDIRWDEYDLGTIVSDLTKGRIRPHHFAHLDPDLNSGSLSRGDSWLPLFGQTGSAQGHLRKNGVDQGDIFLFFGLFRDVNIRADHLEWNMNSTLRHVIWGWLQVGDILAVDSCDKSKFDWAAYHPHFHRSPERNNTIYVAKKELELPHMPVHQRGAGVFRRFSGKLQLTASDVSNASIWELPGWVFPGDDRPPLSYHGNPDRWKRIGSRTRLNAVSRGQEFVLDGDQYPEAQQWLHFLLTTD